MKACMENDQMRRLLDVMTAAESHLEHSDPKKDRIINTKSNQTPYVLNL